MARTCKESTFSYLPVVSRLNHFIMACQEKRPGLELLPFRISPVCCDRRQGGTQLWVGYGCATPSFDHHPITKPEKVQIFNL